MIPTYPLGTVRPAMRCARLPGLLAAVLMASALYGCGSSTPILNTGAVRRAIAASILTQHHLHATVSCPSEVPQKAGLVFTCTASLDVGTYPVVVTETNSSGHVRYENQAPLIALDITGVERAIRQSIRGQRGLESTVICPGEVIQESGLVFTCMATVNGQRYPFSVTEVDGKGHVRYIGRR
jgi:hypothetical protein